MSRMTITTAEGTYGRLTDAQLRWVLGALEHLARIPENAEARRDIEEELRKREDAKKSFAKQKKGVDK